MFVQMVILMLLLKYEFSSKNFFKYLIQCGGANQESHCPDCGERIGGQGHRLLETNRHFSLMDNSQHAAWSNEANLNLPQPHF